METIRRDSTSTRSAGEGNRLDSVDPVDAWVIFSPDAQCWTDELPFWKRRLARDFRHCWVIVRGSRAWAGVSSAAFGIEARVFDCEPDFDLPAALERSGWRVVHVRGARVGRKPADGAGRRNRHRRLEARTGELGRRPVGPMPRPSLIPYTAPARGGNGRSFSALPVELDTRQIIRSFDAASLEWEQFRSLHMEIYDYAIPNRQLFINDSPGARKTDKVFNSAAVKATQRLAGRLQQTIVPAFQTWVRLVPGNLVPTEHVNEVGKFLDHQTDVLFEFINASNFATAIHESLLDLTIGTGALLVQDGGLETPLEYHSVPIFELRPLE